MRTATLILACVGALALGGGVARAELHGWTDENGTFHIAADASLIPNAHRAAAAERARSAEKRQIQVVLPQGYQLLAIEPLPASVPVQRFGQLMRVTVRLNDKVQAPFVIDTGADGLAIPSRIAGELGLPDGRSRTVTITTASGPVNMTSVDLESVEVGGVRVADVPAVINPELEFGLLGLSFLRHFKYTIDLDQGVLILEPRKPAL